MKSSSKQFLPFYSFVFLFVLSQTVSAQSSVLASGNWYKIGVTADGIYKLTYSDLQALGINVASIDPRHIGLYGNGGGMLPEVNAMPRPNDLAENAIEVVGESDGVFDPSDYILFYGQSQHRWSLDSASHRFIHAKNIYADTTYYFLTVGTSNGKRIQQEASLTQAANQTVTEFDDHAFYELDSINLLHSGREWYGEQFNNADSWNRDFIFPFSTSSAPSWARLSFIGRSIGAGNTFQYSVQAVSDSINIPGTGVGVTYNFANAGTDTVQFNATSDTVSVLINFTSSAPGAMGWLNYVELNVRRQLRRVSAQLSFRDRLSAGAGNITDYSISNTTAGDIVWDVTVQDNVQQVQTSYSAGTTQMRLAADTLKEFIVSDNVNFLSSNLIGQIPDQNLHAIGPVKMLIITHPDFLSVAQSFENMHSTQDGLSAATVTTEQIYNEYSSGAQDITAIRDFIRSVYLKSTSSDSLRYVLLIGDGSYDCKDRVAGNTNFLPCYESARSLNFTTSFVSDNFFALMDSLDGDMNPPPPHLVGIGIGRLPVKTNAEAQAVFNKIDAYRNSSLGDWRKVLTFIADDQDQNTHVNQSEYQNRGIDSLYCEYNIEKIYLDAFVQDSVNNTYPGADTAIISRADSGALLIDYIGQGSYNSWAEELSIDSSTFSNFNNGAKLPFYYSATANFNQLDNPAFVSGGERLVLNPNGGGIASLSASRLSYSGSNFSLSVKFFNNLFLPVNGEMPRIGDIWKQTCRDYMDQYTYNFILLGDPALRLAYPVNRVVTTTINGNPVSSNADTLLAGSSVTIDGEIQDASSVLLSGFNGTLNVIVFNHAVTLHTLGNDQYWTGNGGNDWPIPFRAWVDTLYAGTVSVVNGMFSFSFIMPMNIDSTYAFGKISYYAQNGSTDAGGCYNNVVVGGGNLSGIEEANPAISVGVFPNPAKDECHFRVKGYSHSSFSFSLFDISGRRVMEQKETSMDFDVNLSGIGSGMYLYQLESADKKVNSHGKLFVDR